MSTEFLSTATDELAFVRWSGNCGRGLCFEFGTVTQFEAVVAAWRAGEGFASVDGSSFDADPTSADELEALLVAGRVTFGEFPLTLAVGSGELFRFTVEQ